jgi:hypothetical protein
VWCMRRHQGRARQERGCRGYVWRVSEHRGQVWWGKGAPGPRVVPQRAPEMVVHRGNLQERERETEVAEPPGQETETPTQDLEKV